MKVGELGCFLSEYQNLVNEQIFVFRRVTVFSLGTSPDVASETFDSYVWEELCMKKITFCLCQKHAHQCTTLERSESQKVPIPDLSPPHKTSFFFLSFCLAVQKMVHLRSLSCLFTAHPPTSCAPRLKSPNQTVRCVTLHPA